MLPIALALGCFMEQADLCVVQSLYGTNERLRICSRWIYRYIHTPWLNEDWCRQAGPIARSLSCSGVTVGLLASLRGVTQVCVSNIMRGRSVRLLNSCSEKVEQPPCIFGVANMQQSPTRPVTASM